MFVRTIIWEIVEPLWNRYGTVVELFVETFVETIVRLPSISVLRVSRALKPHIKL